MDRERMHIVQRIKDNNKKGLDLVKLIQSELSSMKEAASRKKQEQLERELLQRNDELRKELDVWMNWVIELEIANGIPQYSLCSSKQEPAQLGSIEKTSNDKAKTKSAGKPQKDVLNDKDSQVQKSEGHKPSKKESTEKKEKPPKQEKQPADEGKAIDVSRLDMRVGQILTAKRHPDAETLYVEEIDVGEERPRTVVSGLVKHVTLEEMQSRLVIVLCNLKPAKMRGVNSEAMVMCASTPEKVEVLIPPANSVPGDRIVCDEYPGEPDPLLPPKKKIFEQVAPDLKTNESCVATYKSAALKILGKGDIKSASLTNVQIK